MENNAKWGIVFALVVALAAFAVAEADTYTVTWVIPSSVAHSASYGGACDSTKLYFTDEDSTSDGTMAKINVSSDADANSAYCQDAASGVITLTNNGNTDINITAKISSALSGVTLKMATAYAGYEANCSGAVADATCANINATFVLLEPNLAAAGTEEFWMWTDMSNFNSGAATSGITRTMTTNATLAVQ